MSTLFETSLTNQFSDVIPTHISVSRHKYIYKYNCMYPYLTIVLKFQLKILENDTIKVNITIDNTKSKQQI